MFITGREEFAGIKMVIGLRGFKNYILIINLITNNQGDFNTICDFRVTPTQHVHIQNRKTRLVGTVGS